MTFAKRHTPQPPLQFETLPEKLRRQIVKILDKQRWHRESVAGQIIGFLDYEYDWQVSKATSDSTAYDDLMQLILQDEDPLKVLTVVEYFFSALLQLSLGIPQFKLQCCQDLNRFFLENGVGYAFDVATQKIIPVTNAVLHEEAVQPALQLLADAKFKAANQEYRQAFEHFKSRQYGDCLTECCKALESTLKVILAEKGWKIAPKKSPTLQPLLVAYLQNAGLDGFWEQPIVVLGTIRSRFDAHGAGETPHAVPQHLARYALHATGAAIVLLVDAVK